MLPCGFLLAGSTHDSEYAELSLVRGLEVAASKADHRQEFGNSRVVSKVWVRSKGFGAQSLGPEKTRQDLGGFTSRMLGRSLPVWTNLRAWRFKW